MIKYTKAEQLLRELWERTESLFVARTQADMDFLDRLFKYIDRKQTPRARKKDIAE